MADTEIKQLIESISMDFIMADSGSPKSYLSAAEKAGVLYEKLLSAKSGEAGVCLRLKECLYALAEGTADENAADKVTEYISYMNKKNADSDKGGKKIENAVLAIAKSIRELSEAAYGEEKPRLAQGAQRAAAAFESAVTRGNTGDAAQLFEMMMDTYFLKEDKQEKDRSEVEASLTAGEQVQVNSDLSLVNDFVNEAQEHLENVNSKLLVIEADPSDSEAVNSIFRAFHTMKSLSGFLEFKELHALVKEVENLLSGARKGTVVINGALIDVLFSAADASKKMIDALKDNPGKKEGLISPAALDAALDAVQSVTGRSVSSEKQKIGEILIEEGKIAPSQLNAALEEQKISHEKIGKVLEQEKAVSHADVTEALTEQKITDDYRFRMKETVKIDLEKLDRLIDTIGEMVIAESMVVNDEALVSYSSGSFSGKISHLNKTTKMLHELGLSLRLIPAAGMFQKMARVARDLSRKHNKKINFIYKGEDTEIDRTVVEKISDPLIHMIRNSIDHGIETPEERKKAGKHETALIELSAYHKGGSVYIEISDDGAGLNREKILKRALENKMIQQGAQLPEAEIFDFIFNPGFSTSSVVTDTSGRGVGMDVVRKNVELLRGRIEVESIEGKGTKFRMILPLTTAIIEAIAVRINGQKFFVPTLSIVESTKPPSEMFSTINNKSVMLMFRDGLVPVFSLKGLFFAPETAAEITGGEKIVIITEDNAKLAGLVVDEILEPQQIVVKNLGKSFDKTEGIAACTIMSDGRVGLILDISGIVKMATGK